MYRVDMTGKVVLITGGSRGLGRAMALGLADAGADIIVASRKLEGCEEVCAQIRKKGRRALAVSAHVGDTQSLDDLIKASLEEFSCVDVLINNAGINPVMGGLSDLSPELFQKMFDVNLKGPWYLASRLAPLMSKTDGGSIINIISVGGLKPSAYQGFYASLKSGLNAMTRVMAAEWADSNIRVNAVAPGSYHSDLFDTTANAIDGFEEGASQACLQKRVAQTDEILGPILYLASDMGSYTTGTTVVADGGYLAL